MNDLMQVFFFMTMLGVMGTFLFFVIQIINLKLKILKRDYETKGTDNELSDMRKEIGHLMAENEELKEDMRNIKYLLTQEKQAIDIESYEKEQILIDKENKFNQ